MRLLGCLFLLALVAEGKTAEVAIRTVDTILHDAKRNRDVPIRAYFPMTDGPRPVLFFSHGLGGSRESYSYLGQYWAAHGYVVLLPTHLGSDGTLFEQGHFRRNLERLKSATHDPQNLVNRPADISFLIDSLPALGEKIPELKGKLDANAIGLGGHAFGAYTAIALAGGSVEIPGQGRRYLDDARIKAFLALSPQAEGNPHGFQSDSWSGIHAPFMAMTGAGEAGAGTGKLPGWRLTAFDHMPSGAKWSVYIDEVTHFSAAGLAKVSPDSQRTREYVERLSAAFWDAYLKHDRESLAYLKKPGLPADVTVEGR